MKADDSIFYIPTLRKALILSFFGSKKWKYFFLKSGGVQKAKIDLCQNKINAQGVPWVYGSL